MRCSMFDLEQRAGATEKTFAAYRQRAFDWRGVTCIHLARRQLINMGHRPPPIPRFYSALGARRAMERAGFGGLADIFDALGLPRIAPAQMLVGDLAVVPGEDGFDAVFVCAGGKMLGWHAASEDRGIVPVADALTHISAAWRL